MTDLTAARSYLEQYQAAVRDLDYYASRIETLEARITSGLTPADARAGWTGEYTGRAKDGYVAFSLRNVDRNANFAQGGICNEPFIIPGGDHVCAIQLKSIKPIPKEIAEAINRAFSENGKADDDRRGIGLTD